MTVLNFTETNESKETTYDTSVAPKKIQICGTVQSPHKSISQSSFSTGAQTFQYC